VAADRKSDGAIRGTWNGVLSDFSERQNDLILTCQSNIGAAATNGLRRCWQAQCPFALFDADCGLNPELFRVDGVLSAASAQTITSTAFAAKPAGSWAASSSGCRARPSSTASWLAMLGRPSPA
jgi:hypothetical protein